MNMREKIARAMCWKNQMDPDAKSHINGNAWHWEDYLPDADAALDALMEPTDEMQNSGFAEYGPGAYDVAGPETIFKAMIRAAKEGK
jgi:hypothetical protein